MSDDLIKRSDAIKALRKLGHEVVVIDKVCSLGVAAEFIDAIRDIPSADLNAEFTEWAKLWFKKGLEADRPQGEWIEHHKPFTWMGFTYWTCSKCGYGKNNQNWIQSNFCPNCGASMKGADDDM